MMPIIEDRGFQYGDGLFETMAVRLGEVPLLAFHLARLAHDLARLDIKLDISALEAAVVALAAQQVSSTSCILKLIVTRGSGGRGYAPSDALDAQYYMQILPWPEMPSTYVTDGITLQVCDLVLSQQSRLAGMKHLNRLEQVLAAQELKDDAVEGLLLDTQGHVIEAISANIFIVKGRTLLTPRLDRCGVAGVMRAYLMDLVTDFQLQVAEVNFTLTELAQADEIFLCNSIRGIWPVVNVQTVCEKPVGAVTRALQYALKKRLGV